MTDPSQRLANGFALIRQKRPPFLKTDTQGEPTTEMPPPKHPQQRLQVQFLDPGFSTRASFSRDAHKTAETPLPHTDLYEKITAMLERDYQNTVPQLAYQEVRSKAQNRIDAVHVTCQKLESVVLLEEIPDSPAHWHNIPACHVYLVSCSSTEDYRQRIKPSIQAFVSQLTDQRERPYLLVYCPITGTSSTDDDSSTSETTTTTTTASTLGTALAQRPAARAGLALANRMRQRFNATTNTTNTTGSNHGSNEEEEVPALTFEDLHWNSRLSHLTRSEREVYRRLQADFGPLCALSLPSMDPQSTLSFKKTEWTAFLQSLAAALARGLEEQCQAYDQALRQLDAQRAAQEHFAVSKYFLIKESWAFLYEQYNLPAEALLQYKEARILLPDIRTDALHKVVEDDVLSGIAGTETRGRSTDVWAELTQMVDKGDLDGVRRELADIKNLEPVAPALEDYLFVRETDLLFQMADPIEVLLRSLAYVTAMVDFRLEQVSTPQAQLEVHEWAFTFCWDLKEASRSYLPDSALEGAASSRRPVVENFSRTICDILAYARLRLLKMANIHGTDRMILPVVPTDLQSAWEPWNPANGQGSGEATAPPANDHAPIDTHDSRALLKEAFKSGEAFQDCYLEVMKVTIAYNTLAGRRRAAARLRMEIVEIYVQRGLVQEAALTLKTTAAVYELDQWMECSFMLLFRLAGFERRISPTRDYLQTLLKCFAVSYQIVAPPKALEALQADLDAVVETEAVKGLLLEASPIFLPVMGLSDRNSLSTADRKLVRKVCSVGEEASITLRLSSYFDQSIQDVSIKIDLVPYQAHVLASEEGALTKKSDVVRVLSLDSNVTLKPGENEFAFSWIPMSSGQFIASCIEVEWKGIRFTYTTKEIPKPMVRIDILPADADQSMIVTPSFLLPGHEQPLRIEFAAGLDDVESGEIQYTCSPGLVLLPPGEGTDADSWASNGTIPLPPCERRKSVSLTATVKTVDSEEADSSAPIVNIKITTQYRSIPAGVSDADASKHESSKVLLTHQMEYEISTLPSTSLTVKNVSMASLRIGQTLLGVTVQCHTPEPFTIYRWNIELPSYLTLREGVDMNGGIAGTVVRKGDVVHFGFLCDSQMGDVTSNSATMVVDMGDKHGFIFPERLDLRIRRAGLPRIELPHIQAVPVDINVASSEGFTGAPVEVSYSFETAVFAGWDGNVAYDVAMDNENWILSGSYQGLVDRSQTVCKLNFTAVPVRPGLHDSLPELLISLDGEGLDRPFPLTTRVTSTPHFKALAPSSQSTIMYATYEC